MQSKKEEKAQKLIQSNTTPYPGDHMVSDKSITPQTREPSYQHFPAGILKATKTDMAIWQRQL